MKRLLDEGGSAFVEDTVKKICFHVGQVDALEQEVKRLNSLLNDCWVETSNIYMCSICNRYDKEEAYDYCVNCDLFYCTTDLDHSVVKFYECGVCTSEPICEKCFQQDPRQIHVSKDCENTEFTEYD